MYGTVTPQDTTMTFTCFDMFNAMSCRSSVSHFQTESLLFSLFLRFLCSSVLVIDEMWKAVLRLRDSKRSRTSQNSYFQVFVHLANSFLSYSTDYYSSLINLIQQFI